MADGSLNTNEPFTILPASSFAVEVTVNSAVSFTTKSMLPMFVSNTLSTLDIAYTELIGIMLNSIINDNNIARSRSKALFLIIMTLLLPLSYNRYIYNYFRLAYSAYQKRRLIWIG